MACQRCGFPSWACNNPHECLTNVRRRAVMQIDRGDYPLLKKLLEAGDAVVDDDGEVWGLAADGKEVTLGSLYRAADTERYLERCPTPDCW